MNKNQEAKLQQEVSQANKVKQLFENPLLKESFEKLKKLYEDVFKFIDNPKITPLFEDGETYKEDPLNTKQLSLLW